MNKTTDRTRLLLLLAVGLAIAAVGLGGIAVADETGAHLDQTAVDSTINQADASDLEEPDTPADGIVDASLDDADGVVEVLVSFDDTTQASTAESSKTDLETHAEQSQESLEAVAESEPNLTIEQQFWLTNAALVTVDTDDVSLDSIAAIEDVTAVRQNQQLERPDTDAGEQLMATEEKSATTGLEQIDAPEAWAQFGTQGEDVRVAVLDTGIDIDHPDLDLTTENESDPTYPGGWAEFAENGTEVTDSEPFESDELESHGTHVSGTVAGGNESGTHVGVAPEAELMHGLVTPENQGSFAQLISGMEWAVANDADVVVMSLSSEEGSEPYADILIEPVQNAENAGVSVVSATGNSGAGTSGSPANIYEGAAVGAVDQSGDVDPGSSGETIETDDDWEEPPASWPDQYIVPDVAAPGVGVESTVAGGEYGTLSGTSMATPHVAGIYTLALATDPDATPDEIQNAVSESAENPNGPVKDDRYGDGIANANRALAALAGEGITGTVTDETGTPISEATVTTESGDETVTADDGTFDLAVPNGTYELTVEAADFEASTETVTVDSESTTDLGFELEAIPPESTISGTVTDETDTAVPDATVTLDSDDETTTTDDGTYEIAVTGGTYEIAIVAGGYETVTDSITVDDNETKTADFVLNSEFEASIAADQPETVVAGDSLTAELEGTGIDTLTVESVGHLSGEETLTVDGEPASLGEAIPIEDGGGTIIVELETTDETPVSVSLEHTVVGDTDERSVTTGPTTVVDEPTRIAVIDDDETFAAEDTRTVIESNLGASEVTVDESDVALGEERPPHDVYVVQTLSEATASEFVEATNTAATGVVYLDQESEDATGIPRYADVAGDPAETFEADDLTDPTVEAPVTFDVEASHPILDEWDVDDEITIHETMFGSHSWFEDTDFEVLAAVGHGGVDDPVGPALAIDEDTQTVLASSLAPTAFVSFEYTEEANQILAESVAHVVPDEEPPEDGAVQVDDVESFADYTETVDLTTNASNVTGYQATLEYDPAVVAVSDVTGGEFDDPVTSIDAENGSVAVAQTESEGTDEPLLAEIEITFTGELGQESPLTLDSSETKLSDERGNDIPVRTDDGTATTLECRPGDVSDTGEVTITDATKTQQHILDNPIDGSFDAQCGDLTRDGTITSGDVTLILEEIVGGTHAAPLEGGV